MSTDPKPRKKPGPKPAPLAEQAKVRTVRLDDARWSKYQTLGRAWLERQIDRAKV